MLIPFYIYIWVCLDICMYYCLIHYIMANAQVQLEYVRNKHGGQSLVLGGYRFTVCMHISQMTNLERICNVWNTEVFSI